MTNEKKTINIGGEAFIRDREQVVIPLPGGENMTLYVRRLGYLETMNLLAKVRAVGSTGSIELVAAAIEDEDGGRFTLEQVAALKQEVVEPMLDAALRVNRMGGRAEGGN